MRSESPLSLKEGGPRKSSTKKDSLFTAHPTNSFYIIATSIVYNKPNNYYRKERLPMKLARIKLDQQIHYASINDNQTATLIDGDIFGTHIDLTNTTIPLADYQLLAPVKPPHVYAIGLNYAAHVDEFKHIDPTRANPDAPIAFLCATTQSPADRAAMHSASSIVSGSVVNISPLQLSYSFLRSK